MEHNWAGEERGDHAMLRTLRRALHQIPEVSGKEEKTSRLLAEFLSQCDHHGMVTDLGGHGIAVIFEGAASGETLLFRAELDAVPLQENSGKPWASRHDGVSHACGHDGHMAILCGVAAWLSETPLSRGRVVILFQPAEESGEGARKVLEDSRFEGLLPDYVFALHNIPEEKMGRFRMPESLFACASLGLDIRLAGRPSHAARPQEGISPAPVLLSTLHETGILHSDREDPYFMGTLTHMQLGEAGFGVAPGEGRMQFTLRAHGENYLDYRVEEVKSFVSEAACRQGISCDFQMVDVFPATRVDSTVSRLAFSALEQAGFEVALMKEPMAWSEDFGLFTGRFPGLMVGLGGGLCCGLHTCNYDFPDELIEYGVSFFQTMVRCFL